jgi:hypothetical protein
MNKYPMMSAAVLLAGTGASTAAGAKTVTLCTGNDNSAFLQLNTSGATYNATYLTGQSPATGFGIAGRTKGFGKHVTLSDNYNNYGNSNESLSFDLSLPLKNGGAWALWVEFSGISAFEANSGSYTRCKGATKGSGKMMAATKALIARIAAARKQAGQ